MVRTQDSVAQALSSADTTTLLNKAVAEIANIILGKDDIIRLSLACLVARGHLLEDGEIVENP